MSFGYFYLLQFIFGEVRVFEKGGDASVHRDIIPFSPYSSYVGVNMPKGDNWNEALLSDEKNSIPIVTVDEFGDQRQKYFPFQEFSINFCCIRFFL